VGTSRSIKHDDRLGLLGGVKNEDDAVAEKGVRCRETGDWELFVSGVNCGCRRSRTPDKGKKIGGRVGGEKGAVL